MEIKPVKHLAEQFGLDSENVVGVLEQAGISPVYEQATGRNRKMRLYNVEEAGPALQAHKDEAERAKRAAEADAIRAVHRAAPITMAALSDFEVRVHAALGPMSARVVGLDESVERVQRAVEQVEAGNELMLETLQRLGDQNKLLLRAMDAVRADFEARFGALQAHFDRSMSAVHVAVDELREERVIAVARDAGSPEPVPALMAVEQPRPAAVQRWRVAVVGPLKGQRHLIEKEFGGALDLRFFDGTGLRTKGAPQSLDSCDVVLFLACAASAEFVKSLGSRLVRLGGLTQLRSKLAELSAAAAPELRAA